MEAKPQKMNEAERKRWFSTGFLASGVGSVSAEQHSLNDAAVIRAGEARGHQLWIDGEFCTSVAQKAALAADKGLKARFGHPDMCSDALGTFLGRWKGLRADPDAVVRGSLHLSSTAAESPKGDLRNYVEQMAAKEPQHFGTSIVFTRDWETEEDFIVSHGGEFCFGHWDGCAFSTKGKCKDRKEIPEGMDYYVDTSQFKSPDAANVKNLRHARLSELHAADLVDDPAATDGMFAGAGGAALAARVSEYLDTHPEIIQALRNEPEMVTILERYATELRPFLDRYNANHPAKAAEPAQASGTPADPPADAAVPLADQVAVLETLIQSVKAERERLTGELAGSVKRAETAEAEVKRLTVERDELAARANSIPTIEKERDAFKSERDQLQARLAVIEAGAPPVSAVPAPTETLTPWQKAQKAAPSRRKE